MDYAHFSFVTSAFEDSAEALGENVNGIGGKALATWLAGALGAAGHEVTEVYAEDHGWDFDVRGADARYHCACSVTEAERPCEAHVTIGKHRSLRDRLMGRNKIDREDPVVAATAALFAANDAVSAVELDTSR